MGFNMEMVLALLFLVLNACSLEAYEAPYDLSKFRSVLDDSKLQAPESGTAVAQGNFANFGAEYFYLSSGRYMTFVMDGDSKRSELRQMIEWKTSTSSYRKMIGDVKVFTPTTSSLNQFTFMQIHDSEDTPNKPLIRLLWHRERDGQSKYLWAVVRTSVSSSTYEWTKLIKAPSGFFKAEIKVLSNVMKVKINGVEYLNKNVGYWSSLSSYFKAGVYLQDPGEAKVQFDTLKFYYS